jgi:hypothetical protein
MKTKITRNEKAGIINAECDITRLFEFSPLREIFMHYIFAKN